MKRFFKNIMAALLLMAAIPAMADGFDGVWNGSLQLTPAVKLKLVLHVAENGEGQTEVTLDSPDQNAYGLPIEVKQITDDTISLSSSALNMTFEGALKGGKIDGIFWQNGMTFPLIFEPEAQPENEQSLRFPTSSKDLKIYKKKPTDIMFG